MSSTILIQITHAEIRPAGETSRIMVQEVVGTRATTVEAAQEFDPAFAAGARRLRNNAAEFPVAADFFDLDQSGKSAALERAVLAATAGKPS